MKKAIRKYANLSMKEVYDKLPNNTQKDIDDFIEVCKISAGESSLKKIFGKIVLVADTIGSLDIDLDKLRKFLVLLNQSDLSTDTCNDVKKVLKRFLKHKYNAWNIRFKEFQDIKQKRKPSSEKLSKDDLLTIVEIEDLIRNSSKLMHKALIILLFETAGRPEEIYKLRWRDINFENKEIKLNSAKTGNSRVVVIDQAINRLKLYQQEYPYENVTKYDFVFPSPYDRTKHITGAAIHLYLQRAGKKIGKKVHAYLFRHTRLNAIRKKLSPDVYQKFAGHSMEVALEHYSHIDNDDVRDEMFERIYNIDQIPETDKEKWLKEIQKQVQEEIDRRLTHVNQLQSI